jgi:hypothetical protein
MLQIVAHLYIFKYSFLFQSKEDKGHFTPIHRCLYAYVWEVSYVISVLDKDPDNYLVCHCTLWWTVWAVCNCYFAHKIHNTFIPMSNVLHKKLNSSFSVHEEWEEHYCVNLRKCLNWVTNHAPWNIFIFVCMSGMYKYICLNKYLDSYKEFIII